MSCDRDPRTAPTIGTVDDLGLFAQLAAVGQAPPRPDVIATLRDHVRKRLTHIDGRGFVHLDPAVATALLDVAEAARDAATSLRTLADQTGRDEALMEISDVRGYANSRATVAAAALSRLDAIGGVL